MKIGFENGKLLLSWL